MEHPDALNDDFNISTPESTTVLDLAERIWRRLRPGSRFGTFPSPLSSSTSKARPPWRRPDESSVLRAAPRSTTCSTRSSPGFRGPWTTA